MSTHADVRSAESRAIQEFYGRGERKHMPRVGYILAINGALAMVTFTLVYLTTLSYAAGF